MEKVKTINYNNLIIIILINILIFCLTNMIFDIKYEQVDDFIIYNLYSGLDGTYNFHGVYIHPILCIILSTLFRIISVINWHSIFLLGIQFICFTIMGYILLQKHKNKIIILIYTIFASVFYTSLLQLLQYTSVSALAILTAIIMLIHNVNEKKSKKYKFSYILLYTIGIMLRIQSLIIILPFYILYGIYYVINLKKGKIAKQEFLQLVKDYIILFIITIIVYISNVVCYQNNDVYKKYIEYNNLRGQLHDLSFTSYDENKELFDEIGWSRNDHYLFYTFNFGDEIVYSKENLQKILDYRKNKNEYYNLNLDIKTVVKNFINNAKNSIMYITILFIIMFIVATYSNKEKFKLNILIFLITIGVHISFIILNRSMLRVVIPEYILGTMLFIYNMKLETNKKDNKAIDIMCIFCILVIVIFSGSKYEFNYKLKNYQNYKQVVNYTNEHKENMYLYTVPSLQDRYLAYSVYTMPPKGAFSNLRVMGGWDMFTQNYYDTKERYNLEGTFLDVLKENVYVIDGDVSWSGNYYTNYIDHIVLFIKEHYNIEVKYEKIKEFDNIYIYKITNKNET